MRFQVEEKLEGVQGKTSVRRLFSRFCTPIFLEVHLKLKAPTIVHCIYSKFAIQFSLKGKAFGIVIPKMSFCLSEGALNCNTDILIPGFFWVIAVIHSDLPS